MDHGWRNYCSGPVDLQRAPDPAVKRNPYGWGAEGWFGTKLEMEGALLRMQANVTAFAISVHPSAQFVLFVSRSGAWAVAVANSLVSAHPKRRLHSKSAPARHMLWMDRVSVPVP